MLRYFFGGHPGSFCDGITRRQALRLGSSGLLAGLSLPRLLEMEANAATGLAAKAKSCIFMFLEGGPPHQDMWDPKPDAPAEIRGPYKPIATKVPGTWVQEHCWRSAKIADKFTIIRSHSHNDNGHTTGYHYVMTGRKANFPDGENPVPNNEFFPSLGSIISRELGSRGSIPSYINMPHPMQAGGPGFYGAEHAPFVIESDPTAPDFEVKDLRLLGEFGAQRLSTRRRLLAGIEELERRREGRASVMSKYYEKAYELITSPEAKKAFDIKAEPEKVREAYGMNQLGQCTLLARRLVEAGCRFVGIDGPGWDVHFNCFPSLEADLIPPADQAFSALVLDLEQRGMLDDTLVVMMGEMGRTPRINAQAGRDHWSMAQSVLFAGGGTKAGHVIGATDHQAAAPTSDPISIDDLLRTILVQMGIDSTKTYLSPIGRPVPILEGGRIIKELV